MSTLKFLGTCVTVTAVVIGCGGVLAIFGTDYMMAQSTARNEDGSAVNPEIFREILRRNSSLIESLSKDHADWAETIKSGTVEEFQEVLRRDKYETDAKNEMLRKRAEEDAKKPRRKRKKGEPEPPRGEPQLKTMKLMGPWATEDDAYNRQASEVPTHMRCDACQAITHQAAQYVTDALAKRKNDDKVLIVTLEALELTCRNLSMWMEYGIAPAKGGGNMLVGAGISESTHWYDDNGDVVVPNTAHSDGTANRLSSACKSMLLGGGYPDEDDIATIVMNEADAADPTGANALRAQVCEQASQPCANSPTFKKAPA